MLPSLDHLSTLIAVLDEGTFDAAAARLHVTASAVSQRIKAMEAATGQVLVQRSNPARATAAGESIARYARQVELLGRDLRAELDGSGTDAGTPSLSVAVNADSLATWFLPALADAHREFGVVFDVHREDEEFTIALLRAGTVMGAVSAARQPVQGCTSTPLGSMRYRAVASSELVAREGLDGRDLDPERLDRLPAVDLDRKDDYQRGFLRRLLGREPMGPRHRIPTSEDFSRAVHLGLGWGLLPEAQADAAIRSGALVELAPDRPFDVRLFWQRWNLASPLLDGLTRVIRAAAAEHLRAAS